MVGCEPKGISRGRAINPWFEADSIKGESIFGGNTMRDPGQELETVRESIETSDELTEADRKAILDFSDRLELLRTTYSDHRHLKLLRHVFRMARAVGGLADALEDRDAAEDIVRWINRNYDNEETNRDYRVALRVFGRRTTDGDDPPESLEWVPTGTSSNYDPTPDPAQMLRWNDDIQEMLAAAQNDRDKAAIAVQFDAGLRGGEFESLTIGDVSDNAYGLQIRVDGKQGERTVTLIPSVPYLQAWLERHPARDDPEAPLWSRLTEPEALSYRMTTKMLREPAARAEIDKPVTLTNFRKSSAAHLASKGMNQAHLEDHHGWVRGSKAASRYISVFAEESDRELARVYGEEVEETEDDAIAPIECPRCGEKTPREKPLCVWCGQALEQGAAEKAQQVDDFIDELAKREIEAGRGDRAIRLMEVRRNTQTDPGARAEAIDRILGDHD